MRGGTRRSFQSQVGLADTSSAKSLSLPLQVEKLEKAGVFGKFGI